MVDSKNEWQSDSRKASKSCVNISRLLCTKFRETSFNQFDEIYLTIRLIKRLI